MPHFALLQSPKLISHKIWATQKVYNYALHAPKILSNPLHTTPNLLKSLISQSIHSHILEITTPSLCKIQKIFKHFLQNINKINKAAIFVGLDRRNKDYFGCDAGCLDPPVKLSTSLTKFPVKVRLILINEFSLQ